MAYPERYRYTPDHEWIDADGATGRVGITDYAQQQLGDVVYVELPEAGRRLTKGQMFGTIESVKAVSELFSPVTGEVIEVNGTLGAHPERINSDPHDQGWMIRVRLADPGELDTLLSADTYADLVK
jgi:glycine cleavage system H protein